MNTAKPQFENAAAYYRHVRRELLKAGKTPIRVVFDAAGNCPVCGEAGRCPGWHEAGSERKTP